MMDYEELLVALRDSCPLMYSDSSHDRFKMEQWRYTVKTIASKLDDPEKLLQDLSIPQ